MVAIYACTIFLSAFLLFQVQPIIGKMILPWFGGSAAVWSTCMLFFQMVLLAGYLYAHVSTRYLGRRQQAILHITLLALSAWLLPITPDRAWAQGAAADPTLPILAALVTSIGLPYFVLSSTGPLMQAWYATARPGGLPYRLFALSNFGSLAGLLSYPLIFEPMFAVHSISNGWSVAYTAFAIACAAIAIARFRSTIADGATAGTTTAPPNAIAYLRWGALAALPVVLLMSITSHLTQNIAPVPLLWVLPLVLYLLSFILCFEGGSWYSRRIYLPLFGLTSIGIMLIVVAPLLLEHYTLLQIAVCSGGLFVYCMVCHGELFRLKPAPSRLTSYYLMIAGGGAIGGSFVALIAPRLFNDDYELMLAAIATIVTVGLVLYREPDLSQQAQLAKKSLSKAAVFLVTLLAIGSLAKASFIDGEDVKMRNFYGTVKVKERELAGQPVRQLAHGIVLHGFQFKQEDKRRWPTAYYGEIGGAGVALAATRTSASQRVGIVGLGVGTMAAYCRPGDYYRFYEINPQVVGLAEKQFSYLSDCKASQDIVLGDARLSLQTETPQSFDLLVLDAFSGDSVPIHLLTREAFEVYLRHVKSDGILAVHVSNLHLDLGAVVNSAARQYGREAWIVRSLTDNARGIKTAEWVLVGKGPNFDKVKGKAKDLHDARAIRTWTDDYSSIYGILR